MSQLDLAKRFPQMTPVRSGPTLFLLNGCGLGLYGNRDEDAHTGTYVATWCVCLLFIPVLALRAYRVSRAMTGGWYFIGREPLSTKAKGWNLLVLAVVLGVAGSASFAAYTSTPGYKARRQIASAQSAVAAGHPGQAARIYQALAVAGAEQSAAATTALQRLIDEPSAGAPLNESADVYAAAAQVARRGHGIAAAYVLAKGLRLAKDKGDTDPRAAVALLDAVRPLTVDTRPVDARRLELLRTWAAAEPANLDVVVPLASALEQQDHLDEAKKLLLPLKDKLGDGEGARVLGTLLARGGDYDGAHALLWPYVQTRLDKLHAAEKASNDAVRRLWDREIQLLKEDKAPADFYKKYENAGKDARNALVEEYVNPRIRNDPEYAAAQDALERSTAVVPVALELGMVVLQQAQGQADPAQRKAQLESAEKIFLAVGGVAGETDGYRLSLGQVYYWLGKQADGRKLFDDYLATKGRGFQAILEIAARLRLLGAEPEARALAEEAYGKASRAEEKHGAADFRALCAKADDVDDEIAWLNRANTSDPRVKARLADTLGSKAFSEGRDDEAVRQFRAAVDAYAAMPRSAMTLNQTALAYSSLFQVTGDAQALDRCVDYFQQAVDLAPTDAILLYNAGVTLEQAALADVIGNRIDLRALHLGGDVSLFGYLYHDQAGRDALAKRVAEHPGVARALAYLDKVMILSPRNARAYAAAFGIHRFTRNESGLRALEQRLRAADVDTSDALASFRDFVAGAKDDQSQATFAAAIKRGDVLNKVLRPAGGRTAAVALSTHAERMLAHDYFTGATDPAAVLALGEEAHRADPSTETFAVRIAAQLFRAHKDLRRTDPAYDAFAAKYQRSAGVAYLLAVAASEPGPFQQKVLRHPAVQQAVALMREQSRDFADPWSPHEWALLKGIDSAEADRAAESIRKSPRMLTQRAISNALNPASPTEALDTYWLAQIHGRPEEGRDALRRVAALGIPVPVQP